MLLQHHIIYVFKCARDEDIISSENASIVETLKSVFPLC